MIVPTIGRVVWYYPHGMADGVQPLDAHICYVHDDRRINIGGFDKNGDPYSASSVVLVQEGDSMPTGAHAMWMPYQVQAAKKA